MTLIRKEKKNAHYTALTKGQLIKVKVSNIKNGFFKSITGTFEGHKPEYLTPVYIGEDGHIALILSSKINNQEIKFSLFKGGDIKEGDIITNLRPKEAINRIDNNPNEFTYPFVIKRGIWTVLTSLLIIFIGSVEFMIVMFAFMTDYKITVGGIILALMSCLFVGVGVSSLLENFLFKLTITDDEHIRIRRMFKEEDYGINEYDYILNSENDGNKERLYLRIIKDGKVIYSISENDINALEGSKILKQNKRNYLKHQYYDRLNNTVLYIKKGSEILHNKRTFEKALYVLSIKPNSAYTTTNIIDVINDFLNRNDVDLITVFDGGEYDDIYKDKAMDILNYLNK